VKTKKIRITIEDKYVDVTLDLDELYEDEIDNEEADEEELLATYAFMAAYVAGAITVEIQDINNEEDCPEQMRLQ